jgi:hypothetical protein
MKRLGSQMKTLRKRLPRAAVALVAALAIAGGAWAYWSASGSGSGSASAAGAQAVTIGAGTATSQLYPNGRAAVALTISNPNGFPASIPSLELDTSHGTDGFQVDGAHSDCDVAALSFTPQSNSGDGWEVPPKVGTTEGSLDLDLAGAVSMSGSAANACQGATFTVYLKVGS